MGTIALAVVDSHPVTVLGFRSVFADLSGFEIVFEGNCVEDMLSIGATAGGGVLIVDHLICNDGIAVIAAAIAKNPGLKVVDFTCAPSIESAIHVLEAGARGYVSKSCDAGELIKSVTTVFNGDTYVSRDFASGVIAGLRNAAVRKVALQTLKLSVREDQIIRQLLNGMTNKQIAAKLSISDKTVKHYMTVLMQKLNARNRVEAVLAAQQLESGNYFSPRAFADGHEFHA